MSEYFGKYGDIESIEILKSTKQPEALITFQHDSCVFVSILKPNDEWKQLLQPNLTIQKMILGEDEIYVPPIFMLNPDCFEKLFQYLDTKSQKNLREVCKLFNNLVTTRGFKHIKSFKRDWKMTLDQMQQELECIGKHINQLEFDYFGKKFCKQSLQILCKHVSKNIRHADFRVFDYRDEFFNTPIISILENLTSLKISSYPKTEHEFDFDTVQTMLPNLTTLKLKFTRDENFKGSYNSWKKLEYLAINNPGPGLNSNTFCNFLKQNAQITTLKLKTTGALQLTLQSAAEYLPNLQRLSIYPKYFGGKISAEVLYPLIGLKKLKKLSIKNWEAENLNSIFDCLRKFASLYKLKYFSECVQYVENNARIGHSIKTLAKQLPHLQKICFNRIMFHRCPSVFLQFIRLAEHLKEIHMHWYGLEITPDLVLRIVEILKSSRPPNATPLKLFIKQDFNHRENLDLIQKLDLKSYLLIFDNCKHNF